MQILVPPRSQQGISLTPLFTNLNCTFKEKIINLTSKYISNEKSLLGDAGGEGKTTQNPGNVSRNICVGADMLFQLHVLLPFKLSWEMGVWEPRKVEMLSFPVGVG